MTYVTTRPLQPVGIVGPLRCLRTSQRGGFDARGRYRMAAINTPSLDFGIDGQIRGIARFPPRTNWIRNPRFEPGTLNSSPSNASISFGNGTGLTLTREYGIENGLPYAEFTITGTAVEASYFRFAPDSSMMPVSLNDYITGSAFIRLTGGDWPSGSKQMLLYFRAADGNTATESPNISFATANADAIPRNWFSVTHQVANAATTQGFLEIRARYGAGEEVNVKFRVSLPALEVGSYPIVHCLPPVSSPQAMTTAEDDLRTDLLATANRPWFDPLGGTIFFEGVASRPGPLTDLTYMNLFHLGQITALPFRNRLTILAAGNQRDFQFNYSARSGGPSANLALAAPLVEGQVIKAALSWRPGLCAGAVNGQSVTMVPNRIMSSMQGLQVGGGANGAWGGWTRKIWVERKPYSAAELAAWSAA